jgi:hypothetical protein
MGGMYEVPIGMASHGMMLLCIPSFMMIGWGIQAILRLLPQYMRGFSVGITDGRHIWNNPLSWSQVPWFTCQVSWRLLLQAYKSCLEGIHTHPYACWHAYTDNKLIA